MKVLEIGSVSHGTMRMQDLIPVLVELATEHGCKPSELTVNCDMDDDNEYWDSDEAMWDYEDLTDALNDCVPPYCYFGSHPGDGSDIGCWPDLDSVDMAVTEGEIERSDEPGKPSDGFDYRLHVNDHGNATLYDRDGKELWSVV